MVRFKQKLVNFAAKLYFKFSDSSLKQNENAKAAGEGETAPETAELLCRAAAEGAVLLKNDGTLPLNGRVALFGRVQTDTFYTGYGSGGDVMRPYAVSILEGAERGGLSLDAALAERYRDWAAEHPVDHGCWGNWPRFFPEMPLEEAWVAESAARAETAVVVIGRAAGEDRENELTEGSFYLTREEKRMLALVTKHFRRTAVVLNIGSVIDLSFTESPEINAALLIWQGGMETGNACAKLLRGEVNPSGKLTSAVARRYEAYPSAKFFGGVKYNEYREDIYVGYRYFETFAPHEALYPFGFGLSYTQFTVQAELVGRKDCVRVRYRAENTGTRAGKEVVQIYVKKPCGRLENPARELIAFHKTALLAPGEEERGELEIPRRALSSYDEEISAYVLQAGEYEFFAGGDVRAARLFASLRREEEEVETQFSERCAPKYSFPVLTQSGLRFSRAAHTDLREKMLRSLPPPEAREHAKRGGTYRLSDVKNGKVSMEEFVAQLSLEELEAISRGDYKMNSPLGADGNAGVFGGVLPSLREKGVPPVTATDGPSGIRLKRASSLVPIGTALACTMNEALVEEVYAAMGREMRERGSDVLLAPAMNLQRNPLCGRNFEYFSEDPLVTGRIAAAAVRGVQSAGVSACPKHFACNNQEFNRNRNDSRVSERALRELYLRGFEICVKEGKPLNLMTSYNKINGVWAHYHFDLVRGILRGEWGYTGSVMTDWWMRKAKCPEFPKLRINAYRVRAGVNVLMPGGGYLGVRKPDGSLLRSVGAKGGLTLGELRRNAAEILVFIIHSSAMERS